MTAIVGVMNRKAIAIAADSAITVGNTHKVVNNGNKLFMLSKYEPVGIATYNNIDFMGTPWELIIKQYRKELMERSFSHLSGYVDDFIGYLHANRFFSDDMTQHSWLKNQIASFYRKVQSLIFQKFNVKDVDPNDSFFIEKFRNELNDCLNVNKNSTLICDDFAEYTIEQFKEETLEDFDDMYNQSRLPDLSVELRNIFCEAFYFYWRMKIETDYHTGLVFCGYGDKELYPSIIPCIVSTGYNQRLKFFVKQESAQSITEHGATVAIAPFAQTDVIRTITQGITPDCQNIIFDTIKGGIDYYKEEVCKYLAAKPNGKELVEEFNEYDNSPIINFLCKGIIDKMRDSYTVPLLNTIASLAKEDLANMAESFISLTCLVSRISPGEETVGGPIDVAVISKGDGFIWINRKHYFKPELNKHFFNNYYR